MVPGGSRLRFRARGSSVDFQSGGGGCWPLGGLLDRLRGHGEPSWGSLRAVWGRLEAGFEGRRESWVLGHIALLGIPDQWYLDFLDFWTS